MDKLMVKCPSCKNKGSIHFSAEDVIKRNIRGVVSLTIPPNQICSHALIIYIDSNMELRDCYATDFCVETPKFTLEKKIEDHEIPGSDIVDVDLIKLNLMPLQLTFIIRACIFQEKILIIIDEEFMERHLINFLQFLFKDSFKIDVSFEKSEVYNKNKKDFKNYVVIYENKVFNDRSNVLNPKEIKVERVFINKFFTESIQRSSLIILKNEIQRVFKFANDLKKKIAEKPDEKDSQPNFNKEILEHLTNVYNIKISLPYIKFLTEIIESNYNISIPPILKFFLYRI